MMAEESPMLPDQGSHTMTHVANNSAAAGFVFDNTYARELEGSYVTWKAAPVSRPRLVKLNRELAEELELDADARAWYPGDEGACGGPHKRARLSRDCAAGRGFDARCCQPHPCRHLPILRHPR